MNGLTTVTNEALRTEGSPNVQMLGQSMRNIGGDLHTIRTGQPDSQDLFLLATRTTATTATVDGKNEAFSKKTSEAIRLQQVAGGDVKKPIMEYAPPQFR